MADRPSPPSEAEIRQRNTRLANCLLSPRLNREQITSIHWNETSGVWEVATADGKALNCPQRQVADEP